MVASQTRDFFINAGVDPVNVDGVVRYVQSELQKDFIPNGGARSSTGWLYDGGPFGLIDDDPISLMIANNSVLGRWLPSRNVKALVETVSHLEWVAPEGFDGSQTYAEWLQGIDIAECGYGPSTAWSGFSYLMSGGQFSFKTQNMKPIPDGGVLYHQKNPIYSVRGNQGLDLPLTSDRDWAVARVLIVMQQHLDYVLREGNINNSVMEWDGLSQILTPGYVQARVFNSGTPHWADPLVYNAATITTILGLVQRIRANVRRIRRRVRDRGWSVNAGDQVVYMPALMWDSIAEAIAMGAMYAYSNTYGFDGQQTFTDFRNEYRDTRQGGFGFGTIDVDGEPIPVLADSNAGMMVTLDPGGGGETEAIAGDVYVLTRRAGGMTLLEQQYIDWNQLTYPTNPPEDTFNLQGGVVRAGWVTEANKCYYYYSEMAGKLVSYMQPAQSVIRNVIIPVLTGDINEAGSFTSTDFYAYNNRKGGLGTGYLNPV